MSADPGWAETLRSMVGERLAQVGYKGSIDLLQDAGIHEVGQAVVLSTESTKLVLEWRIRGYDEVLGVVDSPGEAATAAVGDFVDASSLQPWSSLLGSTVAGFGVATQPAVAGSCNFGFGGGLGAGAGRAWGGRGLWVAA